MSEYCLAEEVFACIDKVYPGLTNSALARMVDRDESNMRRTRRQKRITFDKADDMLSKLDMNHLLYTGDIQILQGNPYTGKSRERTNYEKLVLENAQLKRDIKQLKEIIARGENLSSMRY